MYSNPLGPTAATGLGAVSLYGFGSSLWIALMVFTLIGGVFALLRVLPTRANKFYRQAATQAATVEVVARSWEDRA